MYSPISALPFSIIQRKVTRFCYKNWIGNAKKLMQSDPKPHPPYHKRKRLQHMKLRQLTNRQLKNRVSSSFPKRWRLRNPNITKRYNIHTCNSKKIRITNTKTSNKNESQWKHRLLAPSKLNKYSLLSLFFRKCQPNQRAVCHYIKRRGIKKESCILHHRV